MFISKVYVPNYIRFLSKICINLYLIDVISWLNIFDLKHELQKHKNYSN